jgi:broad specificity phosphatase PhoE
MLVRHAESTGNVARDRAEAGGEQLIDIAVRDMDVALSDNGVRQAQALGRWLGEQPKPPTAVLASPYERAHRTAELALGAAGLNVPLLLDERLREREFGILDRLTKAGITARYPDQAEARARVGKFYHRPPGGESWCDVALRVRSALDSVSREHGGERVMLVAHEVVILMFRYVLERLDEAAILGIGGQSLLGNCSVTEYAYDRRVPGGGMRLEHYNQLVAIVESDAEVTVEPDVPLAPR